VTYFKFLGPNDISGRGEARVVNFLLEYNMVYHIIAHGCQTTYKRGVHTVTLPIFNVDAHNHISGMAEVRVAKFYAGRIYQVR